MTLWSRISLLLLGGEKPEDRRAFRVQMLLLLTLSTLLYIGFPGTREWRRQAEEHGMQTIIRGWDGLAWYTWLAAAPVMLWMIRRWPLERPRLGANLRRILLGSAALYLVVTHVRYLMRALPELWQGTAHDWLMDPGTYAYNTFGILPLDLLIYCGFFAVGFAVENYFKHRQRAEESVQLQLRTARLQSDLARAELAALRGQLHPHFLFNSFNALSTLVRQRKNEAAVDIIAQLSALLRLAIDRSGLQEVPLHQEMDFIRRYLEIEHVRFGEKLRVELDLKPESLGASVPNIVLQPLVENSIKHGISQRTTPGLVRIAAARAGDRLHIDIADDGPDGPPSTEAAAGVKRTGIGLANTRAQLDRLYGGDYRLEIRRQPAGGTVVSLDLPWRQSPAA
jgi:two-component system, LytTR family, sensor kinase